MNTVIVDEKLGFTLTGDIYDSVMQELYNVIGEAARRLTWELFTKRKSWLLVPDPQRPELPFYKAETTIKERAPFAQTIKANIWYAADLRKSGQPTPHNHPWPFSSKIIMGGYTEDRYWFDGDVVKLAKDIEHMAGGVNTMPLTMFHEVKAITSAPGQTVTLMECKLGVKDNWGYIDPDTGLYTPNGASEIHESFRALAKLRNPGGRQKDFVSD